MAGALIAPAAHAAGLDLSKYQVSVATSLGYNSRFGEGTTPEASAVAYNWDQDSLMALGDEGAGGGIYAKNGALYPGVVSLNALVTEDRGATFNDSEGITYVGNGQYIVAEERTTNLYKVSIDESRTSYAGPASDNMKRYYLTLPDPAYKYQVSGGANWGNTGLEGISYDPITGGFFGVKETGPERVMFIQWDFNTPNSAGTTVDLFDPASLGLRTLSDIATLSTVRAFDGTDFRDNLLLLSKSSQLLLEVTRNGELVSSFDLSNIFTDDIHVRVEDIEGLTLDNDGNIYLVSETGGSGGASSSAFVKLARQAEAAVPEPASWAMMIAGFGLVGGTMRRRSVKVAFA